VGPEGGKVLASIAAHTIKLRPPIQLRSDCFEFPSGVFYSMPNEDIGNGPPQTEQADLSTEISELKEDVWELLNLVRLLAGLVEMPVPGTENEKAAMEFETRLGAILEKRARARQSAKQRHGLEGNILI
jgi:hypothetical protein